MNLKVFVKQNPFFENSASSNRLRGLLEGLVANGVMIDLFITGGYNTNEELSQYSKKSNFNNINYNYLSKLSYQKLWQRRINRYFFERIINFRLKSKIENIIRNNSTEIIWFSNTVFHFKMLIALKKQYPQLKTYCEISEFLDIHQYNKGNFLQRRIGDKIQKEFENKVFFILNGLGLMTNTLFHHYLKFPYPHPKFLHLPMTVDFNRFIKCDLTLNLFTPYIAFVGVMNNQKDGVDILIEAFNAIKTEFPEVKLYLFGAYNYDTPGHLIQISKYSLEQRVFYKGEVTRDEIPAILSNAELLVLPRPDSKQAQGGFPTKLGEYLASRVPVCATRVGEIPDYLQDNISVFFAEPGSVNSFADAMRRGLSNKTLATEVGLNGRAIAETQFNKDIQSTLLYEFLKNL